MGCGCVSKINIEKIDNLAGPTRSELFQKDPELIL